MISFRRWGEVVAHAAVAAGTRLAELAERSPRIGAAIYSARNRYSYNATVHDVMLADRRRTEAYARGIAAVVRPGDVVVDVGTGTGILACLAALQGARKVYAIDHAPLDYARALAEAHRLSTLVFEQVHSDHFESAEPVDVIIHEQIGDKVFDERMITNLVALRDRVLRPGGRILPNRIDVFIEPAQIVAHGRVPLLWEHQIDGLDFSPLRALAADEPLYPRPMPVRPDHVSAFLCRPEPAFSIDLELHAQGDLARTVVQRRTMVSDGEQQGLVVFFIAHFDEEHRLTNAPPAAARTDPPLEVQPCEIHHWFPLLLRTGTAPRRAGEEIEVCFEAPSLERPETWSWRVEAVE